MDPVSPPDKERNQYIQVHPERKAVKVVRGEEAKWGKKQLSVKVKAAAYLQPTGRGKRKKEIQRVGKENTSKEDKLFVPLKRFPK